MSEESFGTRLRRERERRQIPLASIAATTKINVGLLQALEHDDVSRWPSGIFRRAFIRAYAEAVGLDSVAITREFCERYPDPGDDGSTPSPHAPTGSSLRLTLDDRHLSFFQRRVRPNWGRRCLAGLWDVGSTLVIGGVGFLVFDIFWAPLAVGTVCYYACLGLALGGTPGTLIFSGRGGPWAKSARLRARPAMEQAGAAMENTEAVTEIELVDAMPALEQSPSSFPHGPIAPGIH